MLHILGQLLIHLTLIYNSNSTYDHFEVCLFATNEVLEITPLDVLHQMAEGSDLTLLQSNPVMTTLVIQQFVYSVKILSEVK